MSLKTAKCCLPKVASTDSLGQIRLSRVMGSGSIEKGSIVHQKWSLYLTCSGISLLVPQVRVNYSQRTRGGRFTRWHKSKTTHGDRIVLVSQWYRISVFVFCYPKRVYREAEGIIGLKTDGKSRATAFNIVVLDGEGLKASETHRILWGVNKLDHKTCTMHVGNWSKMLLTTKSQHSSKCVW